MKGNGKCFYVFVFVFMIYLPDAGLQQRESMLGRPVENNLRARLLSFCLFRSADDTAGSVRSRYKRGKVALPLCFLVFSFSIRFEELEILTKQLEMKVTETRYLPILAFRRAAFDSDTLQDQPFLGYAHAIPNLVWPDA
jgi:hypothetical protein